MNFIKDLHIFRIQVKSDITHDNIKNYNRKIIDETAHTLFESINNLAPCK